MEPPEGWKLKAEYNKPRRIVFALAYQSTREYDRHPFSCEIGLLADYALAVSK